MEKIPPELLRCICDNFKNRKAILKAVRLVNRNLACAAAPLLFQTLLVYQTPQSWKNLSSVARCEWLAPYVFKLEVAVLEYLPHHLTFVDWKQSTWHTRWYRYERQGNRAAMVSLLMEKLEPHLPRQSTNSIQYMSYSDWKQCPEVHSGNKRPDQSIAGDMLPKFGEKPVSSIREMELALGLVYRYQRYRYWHDGENELLDFVLHSKRSHLDLTSFPNLRVMSVLGSKRLWKNAVWPLANANRKVREAAVPVYLDGFVGRIPGDVQLSLTLRVLDASAVNITRLELHRYREILASPALPVPPLRHLQELILNFASSENYYDSIYCCERWELAPWLRDADNLHTLIVLSQDPEGNNDMRGYSRFFDVIALLHGIEWPKLRFTHFKETFVRPKSLLHFLFEHRQTLESVRIERPIFPDKKWQSLQSELFAVEFRSPDCRIDMTTQDFSYQLKYATKGWFEDLEDDDVWVDSNEWF